MVPLLEVWNGDQETCNLNYHPWASYPQVSLGKVDVGISLQVSDLGVRSQCFTTGLRKESLQARRLMKRSLHLSGHKTGKVWIWVVEGGCISFLGMLKQRTTNWEA